MKLKIVYMGTPDFAVPPLERLAEAGFDVVAVVSQPDRPSGRRMRIDRTPVRQAADKLFIPVLQPEKVRTEEFAQWLEALQPDIIVTAAYGRILPANILKIPKLGCLNIHASLLPYYRGASPINASVIHGETKTGITIMLMDEGMDTGDILVQQETEITEAMDAGELSRRLSQLAADMIVPVIDGWLSGEIVAVPQNHSLATYTKPMNRDDGKIDWSKSAQEIHNLVRGTTPWPGAYSILNGKRVKIHQTLVSACDLTVPIENAGVPGTITSTCPSCIRVTCGERSCLELISIQAEACRRLDASECFHNFRPGAIFTEE